MNMDRMSTSEIRKIALWPKLPERQTSEPLTRYRISILDTEAYPIPPGVQEVRVLSGSARMVNEGQEWTLSHGESRAIISSAEPVVRAASGSLVFEIAISPLVSEAQKLKRIFYERMVERQRIAEVEDQGRRLW